MCVFISVRTIYGPAGPVREAGLFWHCEQSYSWGQTLEALGPCQEHTVVMVIGGKFLNGVGEQSPEDVEGTTLGSSQSDWLA